MFANVLQLVAVAKLITKHYKHKTMYIPKCFQRNITKQELIEKLKKMYNKDNKETQALQLQQTGVSSCCDMSVCIKLPKCSKQCKDCSSAQ